MRILIVDDSKIILNRISTMLEEEKEFSVVGTASNTIEGKDSIKQLKPDVVITDMRMPGGGGMDILTFTKNNFPSIKVIVITHYTYPQYRERAYELGANYFLSKSEDLEQLTKILYEFYEEAK